MNRNIYALYPRARRAAVAVYLAVSMTVVMGMAALAVDVGALYEAQAELQRIADGAALAAAGQLVSEGDLDPNQAAIDAACEVAIRNEVLRDPLELNPNTDIEFGQAVYDSVTERYTFQPSAGAATDAIRVTARRTDNSNGGPIELMFARFLGHDSRGLEAQAAAVLVPRDIAVVIDVSGSMTYDSQLRYYNRGDGGYANTRDVWCALDGPEPDRPYIPGAETETEYAGDTGPTIGAMSEWGDPLLPGSYSPSNDPGLWKIERNEYTYDSGVAASLSSRGYTSNERNCLVSDIYDGDKDLFRYRVAVILGLAEWHSGKYGCAFPGGGDGDNKVEGNELDWLSYPSYRVNWSWTEYVDYGQGTGTNGAFRYRYGLKTFTDFLLNRKRQYNQTDILWATPEQPLRAVKDAVQSMVDVIAALDSLDHISLEIFATDARHQVNMSDDLQAVADRLYQLQAAHYNGSTCIGGGLSKAIEELKSGRARKNAHKVILLMSDGVANIDEYGRSSSTGARTYATNQAQAAADEDYRIYTISVGYGVDRPLMQEIASIGHGQEFYAAGTPEEYTEQLETIFRALGGKRSVALIE